MRFGRSDGLQGHGGRPINEGAMTERRIEPARVTGALMTEHCDVPAGMTLADWRRETARERRAERAAAGRPGPLRRLLRRGR
jgi:hypothetical protein